MPYHCATCGKQGHKQSRCPLSPTARIKRQLTILAAQWKHHGLAGSGPYFEGKTSGMKQCGEELQALADSLEGR